jgi:hypothetical protein
MAISTIRMGKETVALVLAGDMHQIPTQHTVGIQAQIVVRLSLNRCFWNWADSSSHIENRDKVLFIPEPVPQTLLLWANTLVAVDVEPDDIDTTTIELVDGSAKQAVIDRPAEALDVAFFNPDQCDRSVLA